MASESGAQLEATSIAPSFTVDDLARSIGFFQALGFEIEERWEENGVQIGVMLKAGVARIGLSQDDWKKGRNRQKGVGMSVYIETAQDVDSLAARARSSGLSLDRAPYDTSWGSRAFEITEPTGFKLTISSAQ